MAVQLDLTKIGQKKPPKITTVSANMVQKVKRRLGDLDHKYVEKNSKELAKSYNLQYIDLYGFPIDTSHLSVLTKDEVIEYRMGVFTMKNKHVFLATDNPTLDSQKTLKDKLTKHNFTYEVFYCSTASLDRLIKTYNHTVAQKFVSDEIDIDEEKMKSYSSNFLDFAKNAPGYSMSEMIERILKLAIDTKASDIHFEPEKSYYHIRLRLDGVLQDLAKLEKSSQRVIESRIKIMSKLKLNVDNATQDGRFSFNINGKSIDVRVSMLPSSYGYSVVMRLLGTDNVALEMTQLGFTGSNKEKVENAVNKPQGLILTTGPTGSGKTTTLYTFLGGLNDGQNKIITLEDPIEYKLEGVSQTQINVEAGYTFGNGLRSILRQDPDIVMVGEIRDLETAEIAVQASFTGHLVLSTIHTNDATGAIPRLMQMGLQGYLIADSLQISIGQRLVRKLCNSCKIKQVPNEAEKKVIKEEILKMPKIDRDLLPKKLEFFVAKGCSKCNFLGYKGRIGCYEVLEMNDSIRVLLVDQNVSLVAIRKVAKENGMITMFQDGIIKCLSGVTDIQEVMRNMSR
jgi:type IV pilus assembly protein PilB